MVILANMFLSIIRIEPKCYVFLGKCFPTRSQWQIRVQITSMIVGGMCGINILLHDHYSVLLNQI